MFWFFYTLNIFSMPHIGLISFCDARSVLCGFTGWTIWLIVVFGTGFVLSSLTRLATGFFEGVTDGEFYWQWFFDIYVRAHGV